MGGRPMKFTIKTQCLTTRYYEVEAKTKRKAENYYWKHSNSKRDGTQRSNIATQCSNADKERK